MADSKSLEVIRNLYLAYERGDMESFYKDLSSTLVWRESDGFPTPGVFGSKEEIIKNVHAVLARDWSQWGYNLEQLIDGQDHIVAIGVYRGTHRETGKSFESRAAHLWHVSGGKIDLFEQFADTHLIQCAAMGSGT